ncbi:MAG: response regulator transcription factor [Treponema sp.]|jgi:DNA-binding NarL/FixJ family response regulator|nr:response regulator transcription factor [Treponema sp.]
MGQKIKIMLVDDQHLITESLSTFFSNYADDIVVCGIAVNGRQAVSMVETIHPDIILMDVLMPEMDGVEALSTIKSKHPEIKIIMLSTYKDDEYVRAALLAGASGYLLKDISPMELITVIRALKNNIIQISPEIARSIVEYKTPNNKKYTENDLGALLWIKTLTRREREIFSLLATGFDNKQIANKLCLAIQTVKNHVSVIYSKLGIKDRFEIIRMANRS